MRKDCELLKHIGWYHPASKRFCYTDVKDAEPDQHKGYTIPVYVGHLITATFDMLEVCRQIVLETENPGTLLRCIPKDIETGAKAAIEKAQPK